MGGHISVGVRRADGSFRTVGVWTNPLKAYLLDPRFLEGSLEPLDEFLSRYLKEDEDGFGGPQAATPGEYGFVLVDEIDRTVVNWSHYTRISVIRPSFLGVEFSEVGTAVFEDEIEDLRVQRNRLLPHLGAAHVFTGRTRSWERTPISPPLRDDAGLAACLTTLATGVVSAAGRPVRSLDFHLGLEITSPHWTFVELDHHDKGDFAEARGQVEKCVLLTPEERKAWDDEHEAMFRTQRDGD